MRMTALLLTTSCVSDKLALCRGENALAIQDPAAWDDYVVAIQAADRVVQQANVERVPEKFANPSLIVSGFEIDAPHMRWNAGSGEGPSVEPQQSNYIVTRGGKPVAELRNFIWTDWLGNTVMQCVSEYPELYGILRRPAD